MAEVHGNRTHPPARHRHTGFEDQNFKKLKSLISGLISHKLPILGQHLISIYFIPFHPFQFIPFFLSQFYHTDLWQTLIQA